MTWKNRFNLWFGRERERGTWKKHQNGTVLRPCHNFEKEKKLNMETRDRRFFDLVWTAFRSAIEDCRQKRKQQPKGVPSIRSCFFVLFFKRFRRDGILRRHRTCATWTMVPCRGCHAKENCVRQSCLFVCLFVGFFIVLYYRNGIFQPKRRWFLLSNDAKKKSKSKPNYWPRPFVAERVGRYSQKKIMASSSCSLF